MQYGPHHGKPVPFGKAPSGPPRKKIDVAAQKARHAAATYEDFLAAVDQIAQSWGLSTLYPPGWTPSQWQNEIKSKITRHHWEKPQTKPEVRQKIMSFLENTEMLPKMYGEDFPSFERIRYYCRPNIDIQSTRADSWLVGIMGRESQRWANLHARALERGSHNYESLVILRDQSLTALGQVLQSRNYQIWIDRIRKSVDQHWPEFEQEGSQQLNSKVLAIVAALQACERLSDPIAHVKDTLLRFYLPLVEEFEILWRNLLPQASSAFQPQSRQHEFIFDPLSHSQQLHERPHRHPTSQPSNARVRNPALAEALAAQAGLTTPANSIVDDLDPLVGRIPELYYDHRHEAESQATRDALTMLKNDARASRSLEAIERVRKYMMDLERGAPYVLPSIDNIPRSVDELACSRIL